jgi:hypothetical protein
MITTTITPGRDMSTGSTTVNATNKYGELDRDEKCCLFVAAIIRLLVYKKVFSVQGT